MAVALVSIGCGPLIAEDDGSSTGSSGDVPSTTVATTVTPGTTTGATTTVGTTTSATTIDPDPTTGSADTGWDEDDCGEGCCGFIVCPDGGSSSECDVWAQDCPDGEKCMPWANDGGNFWNATRCSPVDATPGQPGDECHVEGSAVSGIDDCDLGLMCFWVDPITLTGSCVANCGGSEANALCADPDTTCAIIFEGTLHQCLPMCDPLLGGCAQGECQAFDDPQGGGFACGAAIEPAIADFEPCGYDWQCSPGSLCPNEDQALACELGSCCAPMCDLTVPDACGPDRVCEPVYDGQAPPGIWDVGYCALPEPERGRR
ncbi:MAG: hypothetical protein IAG13_20360 [Deltaproteobacteria bacterium]|nr:hypothetical protein [Nannocystaceae bacterium]